MHEPLSTISPIALIYLGMGLLTARIMLEGSNPRKFTRLQWLQFLLDSTRITLLWPLVLFLEKFEHWLKAGSLETEGESDHDETI